VAAAPLLILNEETFLIPVYASTEELTKSLSLLRHKTLFEIAY